MANFAEVDVLSLIDFCKGPVTKVKDVQSSSIYPVLWLPTQTPVMPTERKGFADELRALEERQREAARERPSFPF